MTGRWFESNRIYFMQRVEGEKLFERLFKIVKKNGEYIMDSKKPTSVDVSPEGN